MSRYQTYTNGTAYRSGSRQYGAGSSYRTAGRTVPAGARRSREEDFYADPYWYGSAAPAFYPEEIPEEPRRRRNGDNGRPYRSGNSRNGSADRNRGRGEAYGSYSTRQYARPRTGSRSAQRRKSSVNPAWVAFMMGVLTVMCVFLLGYISLQSTVTSTVNETAQLETQLSELKTSNDQKLNEINSSINLDEIKYKAITRLGMSYADQDQVINYSDDDGDYVHQVSQVDAEQNGN